MNYHPYLTAYMKINLKWIIGLNIRSDPFVVHEHDDWVFTLLRDMRLPPNLVTTSAHYLSDMKKKKKKH